VQRFKGDFKGMEKMGLLSTASVDLRMSRAFTEI
jgi:hypothetical protein